MSFLSSNDLERIFEKLDKNGDGQVSLDELNWLLKRIGVEFTLQELDSLVGKPSLDFNEFVSFYKSISTPQQGNDDDDDEEEEEVDGSSSTSIVDDDHEEAESDLVKAFNVFDINGDGFISSEELESVLRRIGAMEESSSRDCRSMIHVYDTNLDGLLDFQEFKHMMLRS